MTYIIANPSIALKKKQLEELLKKIFKKKIVESPDIHVLNPKEQNSIGIEEVKDLQGSMRYKPFQEEKQVGIILEAEKLTIQAQNALLKTLEETSDTSIYILCVDNERNLLPTIQSRGVIIYPRLQGIEEEESPEKGEESLADILDLDLLEQFSLIE
jgi:DNA polymerase-3 subunit delta'